MVEGGARNHALGCAGRGVGRVVTPVGGTGARVRAGDTLCHRSRRDVLIGASAVLKTFSTAGKVGRVAILDSILPNWVVMVSS